MMKAEMTYPEAKNYLLHCIDEAKSKDWASGIKFALVTIEKAIERYKPIKREISPEWIPMRRNKYPQDGQHVFISTATGKVHDLIWNSKCIQNYARNGCWYKNWFVKAWMPFFIETYKAESEEEGIRQMIKDAVVIERSLCDSCINNGCIFQSGIVRSHCDFYWAESEK